MYDWLMLLYGRDWDYVVKQLSSNGKKKKKARLQKQPSENKVLTETIF